MFSIIIPTYNRVDELIGVFDSLLIQTKLPAEIIIIDDSDSDEIEQLAKSRSTIFSNKNITLNYIRNTREKSLSIARNVGIRHAIGDMILFLDDDVILNETYLAEILDVYEKNQDALGVQGLIQNVKVRENPIVNRLKIQINKLFYFGFKSNNRCMVLPSTNIVYPLDLSGVTTCEWLSGANQSYRRRILDEFIFDEKLRKYSYKEDVDISYRIYKKYPNSLFITPYAKLIHKTSPKSRLPKKDLTFMKRTYSLYFFYKNIDQSYKNKMIFLWSEFGNLLYYIFAFITKPSKSTFLGLSYLFSAICMNVKHIKEMKNGNLDFFNNMFFYKGD